MLVTAHYLCDYPLQGEFIGRFKDRNVPSPIAGVTIWWQLLTAHAFIHALAVFLITQSLLLAAIELIAHWVIDDAKTEGWFDFHGDQLAHIVCKIAYVMLIWSGFVRLL